MFDSSVQRLRARPVPNPHNPARPLPGGWDQPDETDIEGGWIGAPSAAALNDPARAATSASTSLYCPAESDIRAGDRIRADGHTWTVGAVPAPARNPWTGWTPEIEIPLTEVRDP